MKKYLICFITTFIFYQGFTQEKILIDNITIVGNKITKEAIILREITFKKGDFLSQTEIDIKTKQSNKIQHINKQMKINLKSNKKYI